MKRVILISSIMLVAAPGAFAQSDEEILETLRTSITETYLEQLPNDLPESFLNSGLSPSDKERLVQQLANDGAACFVDAVEVRAQIGGLQAFELQFIYCPHKTTPPASGAVGASAAILHAIARILGPIKAGRKPIWLIDGETSHDVSCWHEA